MSEFSNIEKQMLTRLQRGIEITSRPFQCLENVDATSSSRFPGSEAIDNFSGRKITTSGSGSCSETEVLELLKRANDDGLLRRFGGIFDARRLGYKSILCALDVPPEQIEEKAAIIAAHSGVTHCYERTPFYCRAGMVADLPATAGRLSAGPALQRENNYPALWFTLAMLHDEFDAGIAELRSTLETQNPKLETRNSKLYSLPALRRFKIDVVFDLRTVDRDEIFPGIDPAAAVPEDEPFRTFSAEEKALVSALDQQIPLVARPFAAVAEQLGLTEEFVLSTLKLWEEEGVLRRIGVILYHREAGFKANAMCVWPVDGDMGEAGRRVAARPEVTHCYQRPRLDVFPFDLYAMIHTGSWEETEALFQDISSGCGLENGELFTSGREFKKSSMEYFR